ncbi:DUF2848 family protein [Cobetia sp. MC34]|uniref:DUF2848 family protein n=1 Tax=Cobetia sp. MC34 TaxID=2785080 RepID=UPI0020164EF0|nr:DUF2848 family protein [Cobetia sp. MC34]
MLGFLSVGILTLLLAGIPVAVTLFLLAFGIDQFYSFFPLTKALGQNLWSAADSFLLIAIPLFVLMGEIIVRAGIAKDGSLAPDSVLLCGTVPAIGGIRPSPSFTMRLIDPQTGRRIEHRYEVEELEVVA